MMRKSTLGLLLGGAATLAVPAYAAADWSYQGATGPEHWGDLSPEYVACKNGLMQSPIDLTKANARGDLIAMTDYLPGALTVLNNGHTVQVNFDEGSKLVGGTIQYQLLQMHFHADSEEAINGEIYPMSAHFVHAGSDGSLAVLGVLFEEGPANAQLQKIVDAAPTEVAAARLISGVTLDPNGLLPRDLSVYRYQGSLTTPPCTEGVNWHVAKNPITASAEQLAALKAIIGDNARPLQPLNGRLVVAPE